MSAITDGLCTLEIGDNLAAVLDHVGQIIQPLAIAAVGVLIARLHGTIKRATAPTAEGGSALKVSGPVPTVTPDPPAATKIEDVRNKPIL